MPESERRALTEPGTLLDGLGFSFWYPPQPVVVGELTPGFPAEQAGLAIGDRVVAIDGEPVEDYLEFVERIRGRAGQATRLAVLRGGERRRSRAGAEWRSKRRAARSARSGSASRKAAPAASRSRCGRSSVTGRSQAVLAATRETWDKSALTVRFLWRMVTGDVSAKNISGPINIAQYAGLTATEGFTYYLGFLALVSISLAVLNLLPVPVLDGGQVVFQLAEMAKGAPLSMEAQVLGQKVGIAMLVALMGFAFYNDLSRLFG